MKKSQGNWLTQLNGKIVDKIFQVDFNQNRHEDIYLPWIFLITFSNFDIFLEIEGDVDGSHIKLKIYNINEIEDKIKANNMPEEPDLWQVYETKPNEILGQLLGQKIDFIEFGMDKDSFEINGAFRKGEPDTFTFIRFCCGKLNLTIFEGSATGLGVSDDQNIKLYFEETFDKYDTKLSNDNT